MKPKTIITAAQAIAILADENSEFLPTRVLNEQGKAAICEWLKKTYKKLLAEKHIDAWYFAAELEANDAIAGQSIVIEMNSVVTVSGNPETLCLPDSAFDWQI